MSLPTVNKNEGLFKAETLLVTSVTTAIDNGNDNDNSTSISIGNNNSWGKKGSLAIRKKNGEGEDVMNTNKNTCRYSGFHNE